MGFYLDNLFTRIFVFWQIVRLLANHPYFKITLMTADRKAGQSIGSVFPHLVTQVWAFISNFWPVFRFNSYAVLRFFFEILNFLQDLPDMVAIKDADFSNVDAVFCCLPHGTTQVFWSFLHTCVRVCMNLHIHIHTITSPSFFRRLSKAFPTVWKWLIFLRYALES